MITVNTVDIENLLAKDDISFSFVTQAQQFYPYVCTLTFDDGKTLGIQARAAAGAFFIKPIAESDIQICSNEEQLYIKEILSFLEKLAKQLECFNIFYLAPEFSDALQKDVIEELFPPSSYPFLEQDFVKKVCTSLHLVLIEKHCWIKGNTRSSLAHRANLSRELSNHLNKLQKEEPRFLIEPYNPLAFHYLGLNGNLKIELDVSKLTLIEKTSSVSIDILSGDDLQARLTQFFEKIKKNRIMRDLFEEVTYFFDKCLANNDIYLSSLMEKFYDVLRKTYTHQQIEEMCALEYKAKTKTIPADSFGYRFLLLGNTFFLLRNKTILSYDDFSNKENVIKHYQTIISNEMSKTIQEAEKI